MKAIGLIRVSTDSQASTGLGLAAQRAEIERAAKKLGAELVQVFEEPGISGTLPLEERTTLLEALGTVGRGDVLLVAYRDRVSRDAEVMRVVERLLAARQAQLVSAQEAPANGDEPVNVLNKQMLDALSQYGAKVIAQRTKAALAAKKARGERVGTIPFGFKVAADDKTLEPDPGEQAIIGVARQLHAAGLSWSKIAIKLFRLGARSRVGAPFRAEQVKGILGMRKR